MQIFGWIKGKKKFQNATEIIQLTVLNANANKGRANGMTERVSKRKTFNWPMWHITATP